MIGYVFAINGKVNSADVYASSVLFMKLWPKLLRASAIEAISDLRKDQKFEPATRENARSFLTDSESGAPSEKEVTARVKLVTRENKENVFFETRDAAGAGPRGRTSGSIATTSRRTEREQGQIAVAD